MSTRLSSPSGPFFLFFLSSCPAFLLFDRAAGLSPAPTAYCASRRAQMLSRLAALQRPHPEGASAFTAIEHDGKLAGSGGRLHTPVCYLSVFVSARVIPITDVLSAGLATKSMARAIIASTYIRQLRSGLPRCCLHGRSRRRDGAHLWNGRLANADLRCWPTATHPTPARHTRDWGVGTQRSVDVIV